MPKSVTIVINSFVNDVLKTGSSFKRIAQCVIKILGSEELPEWSRK